MTPPKVMKKRLVTSFQKLTPELQEQVKEFYPLGYTDAMMRIDKPNGDFFYAVPFETEEIYYLVKIAVKIDENIPDDYDKDFFGDEIKGGDELETQGGDEEPLSNDHDDDIAI